MKDESDDDDWIEEKEEEDFPIKETSHPKGGLLTLRNIQNQKLNDLIEKENKVQHNIFFQNQQYISLLEFFQKQQQNPFFIPQQQQQNPLFIPQQQQQNPFFIPQQQQQQNPFFIPQQQQQQNPFFIPQQQQQQNPFFIPQQQNEEKQTVVNFYEPDHNNRNDLFLLACSAKNILKKNEEEENKKKENKTHFSGSTVYCGSETQGHNIVLFLNSPSGKVSNDVASELKKSYAVEFPSVTKKSKEYNFIRSTLKNRSKTEPVEKAGHAEVNSYRYYFIQSAKSKYTPGELKLHIASDIAHCVECWWAAHAMFKKYPGKFGSTIVGAKNCENKLFANWSEPWVNFYTEYGDNPFRNSNGTLKDKLAEILGNKACVELSKEQLKFFAGPMSHIYL